VTSIERWVRDWYGLTLHTDRPEWRRVSVNAVQAGACAAGFIDALDLTGNVLAAQLTTNGQEVIGEAVRALAEARDLAWQCSTALAAEAHRERCASLSTGFDPHWQPVCVRADKVGPKVYPALGDITDPNAALRFTRKAAERISADLAGQTRQLVSVHFTGDVVTVSHGDHSMIRPTWHAPDPAGFYAVGTASLDWKRVESS
jgi:hypothetical protein